MIEKKLLDKEVLTAPESIELLENPEQGKEIVATENTSEKNVENINSATEGVVTTEKNVANVQTVSTNKVTIEPVVEIKSELRKAVERVMEADLKDLYLTMSPAERQVFKAKGEVAAKEITSLIEKTKINLNKVLKILFSWLKVLPGVNGYFIEQESKLKADQLLKLPK